MHDILGTSQHRAYLICDTTEYASPYFVPSNIPTNQSNLGLHKCCVISSQPSNPNQMDGVPAPRLE